MSQNSDGLIPPALAIGRSDLDTRPPNQAVEIHSGELLVRQGDLVERVVGRVFQSWIPTPRVRFSGQVPGLGALKAGRAEIELVDVGITAPIWIFRVQFQSGQSEQVTTTYSGADAGTLASKRSVTSIQFRLTNFHDFRGLLIREVGATGYSTWSGRLVLEARGWRVVIDQDRECSAALEEIKSEGGFAVTHRASLESTWPREISPNLANQHLSALHYLFAFLRGFWCGPVVPTVTISPGVHSVIEWGSWRLTPWRRYSASWFPTHDIKGVSALYGEWWRKWHSKLWRKTLKTVIEWYVQAIAGSETSEASIVTSFMALETLAWVYLVQDKANLSRSQFKDRNAAERISVLLQSLNVPLAIPREYRVLLKIARRKKTPAGPVIVAQIRNDIVHPVKKIRMKRATYSAAMFQARELSLMYVELSLLAIMKYDGRYTRRITEGTRLDAEVMVPWKVRRRTP